MLKNFIYIAVLASLATSCSVFKPAATHPPAQSTTDNPNGVQFITNISVKPDTRQGNTHSSITAVNTSTTTPSTYSSNPAETKAIETYPALKFKYAILENCSVEDLDNPKLLSFMDNWYGTPYHYGGMARDGIDCSGFAFLLMSTVYGVASLPRTSREQYETSQHISRDDLREGDLVFFHTLGKRRAVTHVGVYLRNNKFVHASISGVMISDMNDGYYDKHFVGAGRVLDPAQAHPATTTGL